MRIKLKTSISAPEANWGYGEIVEVDDAYAQRLIDTDQAEPVIIRVDDSPKKYETATKKPRRVT